MENMDKMLRGKVLDDLLGEMDGYEYDKKLKPKVITITIDATGAMPEEMAEEPAEEMPDLEGLASMPMEDEDDLDPRLAKLLTKKG